MKKFFSSRSDSNGDRRESSERRNERGDRPFKSRRFNSDSPDSNGDSPRRPRSAGDGSRRSFGDRDRGSFGGARREGGGSFERRGGGGDGRRFAKKAPPTICKHQIEESDQGISINEWFAKNVPQTSANYIQIMSDRGSLRVNNERVTPTTNLNIGEEISFPDTALKEFTPRPPRTDFDHRGGERRFGRDGDSERGERRGFDDRNRGGERRNNDNGRERRSGGERRPSSASSNNSSDDDRHRRELRLAENPKYQLLSEKIASWIIFQNDDIIAINKPAGIAVQAGTRIDISIDDLLPALKFGSNQKPKLVHRLDLETSGVLLLARNSQTVRALGEMLKEHDVRKKYIAIWCGVPDQKFGIIDLPLLKDGGKDKVESVRYDIEGKEAVTRYKVLSHNNLFSLVEIEILTGRTHQIRVHSATLGCGILGDRKYGKMTTKIDKNDPYYNHIFSYGDSVNILREKQLPEYIEAQKEAESMYLHAREITLSLDEQKIQIVAPVPEYFIEAIKKYGLKLP